MTPSRGPGQDRNQHPRPRFLLSVEDWMDDAQCRGRPIGAHDTDQLSVAQYGRRHWAQAAKLCEGCPVMVQCAEYALRTEATGVVMAGIPLKLADNWRLREKLRKIAESGDDGTS